MQFRTELIRLSGEIEQIFTSNPFCFGEKAEFNARKKEILDILRILYGETSREYRVVKFSALPVTTLKVVDHILGRASDDITSVSSAVITR